MADEKHPGGDVFRIEAEAEAAARKLAKEGERGLTNKCPECGSLGSLEYGAGGPWRRGNPAVNFCVVATDL